MIGNESSNIEPETDVIGRPLTSEQVKRRRRLTAAARHLVNEGGYEAVTIDAVCQRAHVARGTVYRYFVSKDHLLVQVLVQWIRERSTELRHNPPVGATLLDRIVESFRRVLDEVQLEPKLFRAVFQAQSSPDPGVIRMNEQLASITTDYFAAVMNATPGVESVSLWRVLRHVLFSQVVSMVAGRATPESAMNEIITAARLLLESPGVSSSSQSPDG